MKEQWFIVDIDTGEVIPGSNRNTMQDCIYWFIEPEIVKVYDNAVHLVELWDEMSIRERVTVKCFKLVEKK